MEVGFTGDPRRPRLFLTAFVLPGFFLFVDREYH